MRMTPSQVGMNHICGAYLPFHLETLEERLRCGREWLVRITGQDFGFDLRRWHAYLCETNAGGYNWSNKGRGFSRRIELALEDPQWQAAAKSLQDVATKSGSSTLNTGYNHVKREP